MKLALRRPEVASLIVLCFSYFQSLSQRTEPCTVDHKSTVAPGIASKLGLGLKKKSCLTLLRKILSECEGNEKLN